jgi:large subunit ribosomal protein L28
MSRVCQITGKRRMAGNSVSHSNRKTRRVQQPNLLKKRLYIPEENRYVTVKLSARVLRTINKKGVLQVLKEYGIKI